LFALLRFAHLYLLYVCSLIPYAGFTRERLYLPACSLAIGALRHGYPLSGITDRLRCRQRRTRLFPRKPAEAEMSWIYILSGVVTVAIVIYLVIALLYPEKF
jgi:K+-transporting ATPase KdpF subunit